MLSPVYLNMSIEFHSILGKMFMLLYLISRPLILINWAVVKENTSSDDDDELISVSI